LIVLASGHALKGDLEPPGLGRREGDVLERRLVAVARSVELDAEDADQNAT
jgi:hypothetical protein